MMGRCIDNINKIYLFHLADKALNIADDGQMHRNRIHEILQKMGRCTHNIHKIYLLHLSDKALSIADVGLMHTQNP